MITGAIMLNRSYETKDSINKLYRNNIFKLFIATEIWLFIYFLVKINLGDEFSWIAQKGICYTSWRAFLNQIFIDGVTIGNIWYMPLILFAYMLLPVMWLTVKNIDAKTMLIPVAIVLVTFCIIPEIAKIQMALDESKIIKFNFKDHYLFSYYFIFVLEGYYVSKGKLAEIKNRWLIITSTLLITFSAWFQYWLYKSNYDLTTTYAFLPLFIISPCVFELIRRHINKKNKVITYIAKSSFALYMIHLPVFIVLENLLEYMPGGTGIKGFFVIETSGIIISYIVISLMVKIPFVRKWILLFK